MTTQRTKINQSDIKIFPSERLTDNPDGGGMPLGTPLTGEPNELFKPIPSIERVNGGFHARLTYQGVQRDDDEPLIGAYSAITKPPTDPNVSYLLFPATTFGETRDEVIKRVEAHKVATIESRMTLLSTQSKGSKIIQAYQRTEEPLPTIGDTYCLRQNMDGYPKHEQYIQILSVDSEMRTFIEGDNEFYRTVVKMEISNPLETDFIGMDYPVKRKGNPPCKVRETHVVNASKFYGIKPLAKAINQNSTKIKIPSLMEKIIPTNQLRKPLPDMGISFKELLFNSGNANTKVKKTIGETFNKNQLLFLASAVEVGSVELQCTQGTFSDSNGEFKKDGSLIATINYQQGMIRFAVTSYAKTIKYRPAVADRQVGDSTAIAITENNQRQSYVITLNPIPAEKSLRVSYLSQGQWYDLFVDDNGQLRGDSQAHGGGNINYQTGTASVTCGELPDVGSHIIFSWATASRYQNKTNKTISPYLPIELVSDTDPTSITVNWQLANEAKTATIKNGKLLGNATGFYDKENHTLNIDVENSEIDNNAEFTVSYKQAYADDIFNQSVSVSRETTTNSYKNDKVTINFNKTIERGFIIESQLKIYQDEPIKNLNWQRLINDKFMIYDDKNGNLIDEDGNNIGTVDYSTGKLIFIIYASRTMQYSSYQIEDGQAVFKGVQEKQTEVIIKEIKRIYYYQNTSTIETVQQAVNTSKLILLLPNDNLNIAKNSAVFQCFNKYYFDRNGEIFTDYNIRSNAITPCGTIDYITGKGVINHWKYIANTSSELCSLATYLATNPIAKAVFRIPTVPVAVASLQVRAQTVEGNQLTAQAQTNGEITGENVSGQINTESGFVEVNFSEMVVAESIAYNAVARSFLPIDSDIIKIDTVRLPSDGRVPIFRRGDTILIGNRQSESIGSAFNGGETVQLGRQNLDRICLKDSKGKPVLADLWDYDLEQGTITFTKPLDISSYQKPLIAYHSHEERNRILKADIDGTLELMFPTKHDYPLENTYVSSVLISGDLQVRVYSLFTQRSWNNIWADEPQGEQLLNKLNLTTYPMLLTDDGAITERWLIKFNNPAQFELYGEKLGFVGRFDTLADVSPVNPATNKPYFTIKKEAFGNTDAPWARQDVIRFNTEGTLAPIWVLCAVQPSITTPQGEDSFTQCLYGDTTEI